MARQSMLGLSLGLMLAMSPVGCRAAETLHESEGPNLCGFDTVVGLIFKPGAARLDPNAHRQLLEFAADAKRCDWRMLEVIGASDPGEASSGLAAQRANVIAAILRRSDTVANIIVTTWAAGPQPSDGIPPLTRVCSYRCFGPAGWVRAHPERYIPLSRP